MARPQTPATLRVLYVEDDRLCALLFAEMLRGEAGITLRLAEDAAEALAIATDWPPDVLVLDAWLPDLSGHELLPRLLALPGVRPRHTIMCSADSDPDDRARAAAAGFAEFWAKPVAASAVRAALQALATAG
ncbi:response regulator [Aquabacterium sp. OR-4]|uniref:response regulator n=1 Tax=Aquabacterium sp. OR-4 TaxID=2978127 RepID=UPI0028C7725E|nr:response regulator [Aquabacterium sp. OR-4]MDT7835413.1 response regulator [Aquabacterium sp. OR-4]